MKYKALTSAYVIAEVIALMTSMLVPVLIIVFLLNTSLIFELYIFFFIVIAFFIISALKYFWDLFFGVYSYTLFLDEHGVKYILKNNTYFLKWEEIRYIQVMPDGYDRRRQKMICFNAGDIQRRYIKAKYFHGAFFGVHFSRKLVNEIEKYWDKPIQGVYHIMGPKE